MCHEGIEFLSIHPLLRWKTTPFIKDECGGKAIHPKLPIEVQMKWSVIITSIGHQSKSRKQDLSFESLDLVGINR
jgi:hypothetical protein